MAHKDPRFFMAITRVDDEERMVYGYGTREDIKDSYGTIIDLESVKKCLPDYLKWRNVREMHEASAVGTADEVTVDDKGVFLGVKVVDDNAWKKVKESVYKGFSVGGKKDYQEGDRLFLKQITEFSLVDRPANDGCKIDEFRLYGQEDKTMAEKQQYFAEVKRLAGELKARNAEEDIKRGFWQVSSLANALDQLSYVEDCIEYDTGEGAEIPSKLADAMKIAGEALVAYVQKVVEDMNKKEAAEVVPVALAEGADADVERKGAAISADNLKRVQAVHDHAAALGAKCGDTTEKAAGEGDDVARKDEEVTRLQSDVTRLQGEIDTLRAENETLKAEPEPAKGVLRAVGKEADTVAGETTDAKRVEDTEAFKNASPLEKAKLVMRSTMENPQAVTITGIIK